MDKENITDKNLNKDLEVDDNIKISANISSLNDKIQINIKDKTDIIYWYIKFNNQLDPASITKDSMTITDTHGYIMKTYIYYKKESNIIVISPIDSYKDRTNYLLNISEDVRSAKGNKLEKKVHILFKLFASEVSEYEILKRTIEIPEPIARPENYDFLILDTKIDFLSDEKNHNFDNIEEAPQQFSPIKTKINFWFALVGVLLLIGSFFTKNEIFMTMAFTTALIGVGHIISQLIKKETRSQILYNKANTNFKNKEYLKAHTQFKKSYELDPNNTLAEFAANKSKYYI